MQGSPRSGASLPDVVRNHTVLSNHRFFSTASAHLHHEEGVPRRFERIFLALLVQHGRCPRWQRERKVFRVRRILASNVAVNMMLSAPTLLFGSYCVVLLATRYPMGQDWLGDVKSQCRQPHRLRSKGPRRITRRRCLAAITKHKMYLCV